MPHFLNPLTDISDFIAPHKDLTSLHTSEKVGHYFTGILLCMTFRFYTF